METLLGVPVETMMVATLLATVALGALLVRTALRRPLLARLALRNPRRRPVQAGLITLGLTLSAIIMTTALTTGDTMSYAVRSLVVSALGRADEVVVALPRDQRRNPGEYLGALLNGSLLTGLGTYFSEEYVARLEAAAANDDRIAAVLPAIGEQVTVVNLDLQSVQGQVSLLALPPVIPSVFGTLAAESGEPAALADLGPGGLLVDPEAAAQLAVEPGSQVRLRTREGVFDFQVRGIVRGAALGGARPTLFAALPAYQQTIGRRGQINQILVANQAEATESVRLSAGVARTLRVALADPRAGAAVFELLRSDLARGVLERETQVAEGRPRQKLERLRQTLDEPTPPDDFVSLVTDPDLERRLFFMAGRLAGGGGGGFAAYQELSPLRVLEIKQLSQDQAERWGGALTSAFLILGLFSLATGALLVFLIFVMLAAERRSELGITRAVGARRRDVIAMFLMEGALYDLVGSAVGVLLGLALTLAITAAADAALAGYGAGFAPRVEGRTLVLAYCLGALTTYLSVGLSSWQVSRLSVVAAIRDLPAGPPARPRLVPAVVRGALVLIGIGLGYAGSLLGLPIVQAAGVALAIVGVGLAVRQLFALREGASHGTDRIVYSATGAVLLAYWLLPAEWPVISTLRPLARSVELFFLAGVTIVLGAVLVLMFNLDLILAPLVTLGRHLRMLAPAVATAVAAPLQHRFRTGMIVAMFALVIFSMVVGGVLLTATHRAYDDPEALAGGFDVRAELARPTEPFDLVGALGTALATRPDDFASIGRITQRPAQVIELAAGARRWRSIPLVEADAGFVQGLRASLATRATGYASDSAVWEAVLSGDGYAVVSGNTPSQARSEPGPLSGFALANLARAGDGFPPSPVWVRDERGGRTVHLKVIGMLDPRVSFGVGLYSAAGTLSATGAPAPQRVAYYLKARDGADPNALAAGLNLSFGEQGLRATAVGEELRRIHGVRVLLNELLQGFFGVGLLAGLAALGVVSMRAVVERRQQVGVLRSLGFRREAVRLSFFLETSLVALLGIGSGAILGLALAHRLVEYLGRQYPEVVFSVPWGQIGMLILGTYLTAMAFTALPLWQIGRIPPAAALRSE